MQNRRPETKWGGQLSIAEYTEFCRPLQSNTASKYTVFLSPSTVRSCRRSSMGDFSITPA
jgi:hypothetical protein